MAATARKRGPMTKARITGPSASEVIDNGTALRLTFAHEGERVFADPGSVSYARGAVARGEVSVASGMLRGMGKLTAGSATLAVEFIASGDACVLLTPPLPGATVVRIDVSPAEPLTVARRALVAWTPSVTVSDSDALTVQVAAGGEADGAAGVVWLAACGGHDALVLQEREVLTVDRQLILAMPNTSLPRQTKSLLRGWASLVSGRTSSTRKFVGPARVWLQRRSLEDIAATLAPYNEKSL